MTLMTVSTQGSVAILTMTTAENRHNPAFAEAFLTYLDQIESNLEHTACKLATDHVIEQACPNSETLFNTALEFANQFNKKRAIFVEHKKRFHKHIINTIDIENKPIIDAVQLVV